MVFGATCPWLVVAQSASSRRCCDMAAVGGTPDGPDPTRTPSVHRRARSKETGRVKNLSRGSPASRGVRWVIELC
jgi:hypothetical protein